MKKMFCKVAVATALLLTMIACGSEKKPQGNNLGHTEYYESSIFKSYTPVVMSGEVEFKLNNDAQAVFANGGTVTFHISTDPNKIVVPEGIIVYCDGKKCEDASFDLNIEGATETLSCTLGLEFEKSAKEGVHQLYILYANKCQPNCKSIILKNGDKQIPYTVNPNELKVDIVNQGEFYIEKSDVSNPGNVIAGVTFATILGLFILSLIIARMMQDRIGVNTVNVMGANYQSKVRIKGYRMVVFTNASKKQGFMDKLYKGPILYVKNELWTSDVTILPRGKKRIKLQGNSDVYLFNDQFLERGQDTTFEMVNENGSREKIEMHVG